MKTYGLPERFWNKVDIRSEDECWEWQASKSWSGYGFYWHKNKIQAPHRVLAKKVFGMIPDIVRHKCDNPSCVNPNHLELGSQADNIKDKQDRDRQPRGSEIRQSKLCEKQVIEIYKSSESYKTLAKRYNVAKNTIAKIKRHETWKHLTNP